MSSVVQIRCYDEDDTNRNNFDHIFQSDSRILRMKFKKLMKKNKKGAVLSKIL